MNRGLITSIEQLLDDSGLPWHVTFGGKHRKVFLDGRMIAILPRNLKNECGRAYANTMAQIRRAIRQQRGADDGTQQAGI